MSGLGSYCSKRKVGTRQQSLSYAHAFHVTRQCNNAAHAVIQFGFWVFGIMLVSKALRHIQPSLHEVKVQCGRLRASQTLRSAGPRGVVYISDPGAACLRPPHVFVGPSLQRSSLSVSSLL